MNKVIGILTLILLSVTSLKAQQALKFGHINSSELIALMPEMKTVQSQLESDYKEKENQLSSMQQELQTKQVEYQQSATALTPNERSQKEQEIGEMSQKIQNYYTLAQQQMQAKQQELQVPIIQKLQQAIQEVGEEQGFLYIFDLASRVPVFNSDKSIDVTPFIKAKLGIQ